MSGARGPVEKEYSCEGCPRFFPTARGLATHERHAHPALRNEKRLRSCLVPKVLKESGRKVYQWTEECAKLSVLIKEFSGDRRVNIRISEALGSKTPAQVRARRRTMLGRERILDLTKASIGDQDERIMQTPPGCSDLGAAEAEKLGRVPDIESSSENIEAAHLDLTEENPRQLPHNQRGELRNWQRGIFQKALDIGTPKGEKAAELCSALDGILSRAILGLAEERIRQLIENFVTDWLHPALIPDGEDEETKCPRRAKSRSSKFRRKGPPRNGKEAKSGKRKRFAYARSSDMFQHCPRRLAGLVVSDRLDSLWQVGDEDEKPPAHAVRRLYEGLWGKAAEDHLGLGDSMVKSIHNNFDYLCPKEVRIRLRATRPGTAAGLDGITKHHLVNFPGIAKVLAKLFNLLLGIGFFPREWKKNRTTLLPKDGCDTRQPES
ncbi:uncharacterized protein [Hetaerina americana]|uniref:uncharacterized protein n=1 Tax=Hetaerina americana TaxID=62018 RepID=UPI003A7F475B